MINDKEKVANDLSEVFVLFYRELKTIYSELMRDKDYSKFHVEVMKYLRENGKSKMTDIGKELKITKSYVTALVDKLEKEELTYREHDSKDRRVILIALTEKGEDVFRDYRKKFNEYIYQKMSEVSSEELDDLEEAVRLIKKVSNGNFFSKTKEGDR